MSDLDRYAAAIHSLTTFSVAAMQCEHGLPIAVDCDDCEPLLICDPPPIPFSVEDPLRFVR